MKNVAMSPVSIVPILHEVTYFANMKKLGYGFTNKPISNTANTNNSSN